MNGSELGQRYQSAREMTEEIDQAASAEQERVQELQNLGREEAVSLGNRVLTYNPDSAAGEKIIASNEQVVAEADKENDYSGIGVASNVQLSERKAWDEENILNEANPKRDYEAEIAAKDQRAIANSVAEDVEKVTRGSAFQVSNLVELRSRACGPMLESYENPYRLGDGN